MCHQKDKRATVINCYLYIVYTYVQRCWPGAQLHNTRSNNNRASDTAQRHATHHSFTFTFTLTYLTYGHEHTHSSHVYYTYALCVLLGNIYFTNIWSVCDANTSSRTEWSTRITLNTTIHIRRTIIPMTERGLSAESRVKFHIHTHKTTNHNNDRVSRGILESIIVLHANAVRGAAPPAEWR